MSIIQLKDQMLSGVVGGAAGIGRFPYETVVVDNGHIYVALDKTSAQGVPLNRLADILVRNARVLVAKPGAAPAPF